jgi:hypothetical protein
LKTIGPTGPYSPESQEQGDESDRDHDPPGRELYAGPRHRPGLKDFEDRSVEDTTTWVPDRVRCFICQLLEHLLVPHQLGNQELEPLDLSLQLAAAAIGVDLGGVVAFSPVIVGRLGDAELAADIGDRQTFGQVAVRLAESSRHRVGSLSFPHGPLLGRV